MGYQVDSAFLGMAAWRGMRAAALQAPYAVFHQRHAKVAPPTMRHSPGGGGRISREDVGKYLNITFNPIDPSSNAQPAFLHQPGWGLKGQHLPEYCFVRGKLHHHDGLPCLCEDALNDDDEHHHA